MRSASPAVTGVGGRVSSGQEPRAFVLGDSCCFTRHSILVPRHSLELIVQQRKYLPRRVRSFLAPFLVQDTHLGPGVSVPDLDAELLRLLGIAAAKQLQPGEPSLLRFRLLVVDL